MCQVGMMVTQVVFMVAVTQNLYCYHNNTCDPGLTNFQMYLMYAQFSMAFIFEAVGIILCTNMMMSLGWFYTEHFPPDLKLEQYHLERPDKMSSIFDLFPHPVNYQF